MNTDLPGILIHVEFANDKNRIRLHVNEDDQTYRILDNYWSEHYKQGEDFPSLGFSINTNSDVYELTSEQLFHVLAKRLGSPVSKKGVSEHRPTKKPLTPAQREARQRNAEKARNRRSGMQSV